MMPKKNRFLIKKAIAFALLSFLLNSCSKSSIAISTPNNPNDGNKDEKFEFQSFFTSSEIKANNNLILELDGVFPNKTIFELDPSSPGSIIGKGNRINYLAPNLTGNVEIKIRATYQQKTIEKELVVNLLASDPAIELTSIEKLNTNNEAINNTTNRYRFKGQITHLANPENYKVAVFQRAPDAYYYLERHNLNTGTFEATPAPINADGTFDFIMRRGRQLDAYADNVTFILTQNDYDPYSATYCPAYVCAGHNSEKLKKRLPLPDCAQGEAKCTNPSGPSRVLAEQTYARNPINFSHANKQIEFITKQILSANIQADPSAKLIKSFESLNIYALYDQALAIMALTHAGENTKARELIKGLDRLYVANGGWYFSYAYDGDSPYPAESDRRIAGAIAWVAMALNYYQYKVDSEFEPLTKQTLDYLLTQVDTFSIDGESVKAIRFAPAPLGGPVNQTKVYGLEHTLDLYSALRYYSHLNNDPSYLTKAEELKPFINKLWNSNGSFYAGFYDHPAGGFNKDELYLDTQTWSILALGALGPNNQDLSLGLVHNCNHFFETAGYLEQDITKAGIFGFYDMKIKNSPSTDKKFVWSEGTAGQILALKIAAPQLKCKDYDVNDLIAQLKKLELNNGGVVYATKNSNPNFTSSTSIAGATWYYFVENNFNPFQIYPLE